MRRRGARPIADIGRLAHDLRFELRLATQAMDQPLHGTAAIACLGHVGEGEPVGFEFLLARIASQCQQAFVGDRSADRDGTTGRRRSDGSSVDHVLAYAGTLCGVTLNEMAEFMAERGGEFGLVFEDRQQAARHEHIARHGMRIRQRLVEHGEAIASGEPGRRHDAVDRRGRHRLAAWDRRRPARPASRPRAAGIARRGLPTPRSSAAE